MEEAWVAESLLGGLLPTKWTTHFGLNMSKKQLLCLKHNVCLDLYVTAFRVTLTNTDTLRKVVGLIHISAWVLAEKFRINIVNDFELV